MAAAAGLGVGWLWWRRAAATERRERSEAAHRASEERFRLAFKITPEPLALTRLDDGVAAAVNDGFLRLYGLGEHEVVGRSLYELGLFPDPGARRRLVERVRVGEIVHGFELQVRAAGGALRLLSFSASRIDLEGVPHMLALGRDVTQARAAERERDRLEAELRRSEERSRAVLRNVPVVQWATDASGVFTLSEGRGLSALGLKPGQVVGLTVKQVYADNPGILRDYERALAGESFVNENVMGTSAFESHWGPLRDESGKVIGVTGIALDVSPRRAAEQARREGEAKLQLLERLAAMGRAAAGLAHEVNNPLTYVIGNLDAALERLPACDRPEQLRELLADARAGADRVRQIVGELRVFSRARQQEGSACSVEEVLRSAVAFTRNEVRHRARLEVDVTTTRPVAMSDGRLAQVLVNLITNACNALPEGEASGNLIRIVARDVGERVVLEVSDTGAGMAPEVRARVFEPFFTTRAEEGGMGMGLPLTRSLVLEAGGEIAVESEPGRGTTLRVTLPVAPEPGTAAPAPAPPPKPPRARVLVVDDEPLVGRAVARILAAHEVETVTTAREAMAKLRGPEPFDAVVCDLMMPEMTGMDLHDVLLAEQSEYAGRLVFLTGGAFTERARDFVARTAAPVLDKPVDAEALRAAVAELAAASRAR